MKKVLYLSNIEVPYRVRFFNELARYCDLTVLYERENSSNRNPVWAKSEQLRYRSTYLNGLKIRGESTFSLSIIKEIFSDYDDIIVGCYNSPVQMFAILIMRLFRIPYIINLDGEPFLDGKGLKSECKRFFLRDASQYLVAGQKACESLKHNVNGAQAVPYYFSSLSEREVNANALQLSRDCRDAAVLVVGQYFDYKGMDVALEAASMDLTIPYRFVGMGSRTELFLKDYRNRIPPNVEIIPFLQKRELEAQYASCAMLVLPSRQECWGLVINEAASFGTPIVSTWGSGAAVEFLSEAYPDYLAEPGNPQALYDCIRKVLEAEDFGDYQQYLLTVSKKYTIENSVRAHLKALEIE